MKVFKQALLGLCTFTFLFMLTPGAWASEWDQKVVTTFNNPVAIPGQVLPSGTYVFKILNVMGTRDVVQVSNANESRVLATTFAIPRYRPNPTSDAVFVLSERGADSPPALQAWYYPGFRYGHEFVYAAAAAPEALTATNTAMPAAPTESAPIPSATSEQPSSATSDESNVTEPAPEATTPSTTDQNQTAQPADTSATTSGTTSDQTNKELPKTASTNPLIALIGMLLLGGALGLKLLASKVS
jgi:LPXTG-motif cell wall-anchored protein